MLPGNAGDIDFTRGVLPYGGGRSYDASPRAFIHVFLHFIIFVVFDSERIET